MRTCYPTPVPHCTTLLNPCHYSSTDHCSSIVHCSHSLLINCSLFIHCSSTVHWPLHHNCVTFLVNSCNQPVQSGCNNQAVHIMPLSQSKPNQLYAKLSPPESNQLLIQLNQSELDQLHIGQPVSILLNLTCIKFLMYQTKYFKSTISSLFFVNQSWSISASSTCLFAYLCSLSI